MKKYCPKCEESKPPKTHFYKDKYSKDGFSVYCRECIRVRNKQKHDEDPAYFKTASARWRARRPKSYIKYRLRNRAKKFGMTVEDLVALTQEADGHCMLCEQPSKRLAVDHCHETGRVRGLLCMNCNTGLGRLGDNIAGLKRAIKYLKRT